MKKNFQGKAIILKILQGRWCALAYPESPIQKPHERERAAPTSCLSPPLNKKRGIPFVAWSTSP